MYTEIPGGHRMVTTLCEKEGVAVERNGQDGFCFSGAGRRPSRSGRCCPEGGYIVERIVSAQREDACFHGLLQLCGLTAGLCPPLCLQSVEAISIEPCCMPGECQDPCGMERLALTLCVCVADSRGCRGEATARIEIQARRVRRGCGLNVRRGAEIAVQSACFCAPCAFEVCLSVCVNTVLSRLEMVARQPSCCAPCPDLPLYPPPICPPKRTCRNEHFCC